MLNEMPRMNADVLSNLRNTAFPQIEQVANGTLGDGADYYWALTSDGADGSDGPVWIVPARKNYGLPFLEKWYSASVSKRWRRLARAYRNDRLGEHAGAFLLRMPPPPADYWAEMGWPGSIPPVLVGYAGSLGKPWQKVVAGMVRRETGIAAMVAKFPMSDTARDYIKTEADTLERLERELPGAAARPILFDREKGILVEEALNGEPAGKLLHPLHLPFLVRLARKDRITNLHKRVRSLREHLDRVENPGNDTISITDQVCEKLDDKTELPAMWVHGDLHAGNMILRKQGVVQAMDWAFAKRRGLPFYDIIHAKLLNKLEKEGDTIGLPEPDDVHHAYANALKVDIGLYRKVAAYYVARHMLDRYISGKEQAGDMIRIKLKNWMNGSLTVGQ